MPLTNPRFAGDPVLEACVAGAHRMMAPETGPAVAKVQQALIDLGFTLAQGADGSFGDETGAAVVSYKTNREIFPNDPVVGQKTMASLDTEPDLAPSTPSSASREARVLQAESLVTDIGRLLGELSGVLASLRADLR